MAVEVNPNPTIGVGIWIMWAAYLIVSLFLLVRQFLGQWALPFRSSSSDRPQRSLSSQTLLDYFKNDEFVGPVRLTCVMMGPVVMASVITNTPADIYLNGFAAFSWLPAILFGVVGYMLVAARLSKISTIRNYSSPIDFLNDRYRSKTMRALTGSVMVVSAVIVMALLIKTAGSLIEVISVGSISALSGAIGVGAVILCFELLGGLSSVGLIDVIHCCIMALSFFSMYILQSSLFGGFAHVLKTITSNNPAVTESPYVESHLAWILWTIPFIALPLYPHLLPRLQSYHSSRGLRFALVALSLVPFFVVPAIMAFGFSGRSLIPDLPRFDSVAKQTSADIFALTIRLVMIQGSGYYILGSLLFIGSMSVVMSTTSGCISGVSAVVALDLYRPMVGSGSPVHIGRIISVVSTIFLLSFAVVLSDIRLMTTSSWVGLLNGILLQLMPALLLGLYSHFNQKLVLNIGMLFGIITAGGSHVVFALTHSAIPADLGALLGLIVNVGTVYGLNLLRSPVEEEPKQVKQQGSISNDFSLQLSQEISVEAPMNHKTTFGKFRSAMPSGLVGWRMNANLDLNLELDDLSVSEQSRFSSGSFAIDHARIGSTTLGSIGRVGDGNTEPIHNPVLLGASLVFLVLSSPFYFSSANSGVSTNGIPFWIYLSFLSALMSSAVLVYIMFSSWDVKDPQLSSTEDPSVEAESVLSDIDNSVKGAEAAQQDPSFTMESRRTQEPAITRFSSAASNAFGRFSRPFFNEPRTQPNPLKSSDQHTGNEKSTMHKTESLGRRPFKPFNPDAKTDKNTSLPSTDFGSELGSFSLEEEIRHRRYA